MSYFTERNNMRKPIQRTSIISIEMYALIKDCCERYLENLAWKYTDDCPDGRGICGINYQKFSNNLKFDIPDLYRDYSGRVNNPVDDEFNQYALLDYVEYIAQNLKDINARNFHSYFGHDDLTFCDTSTIFVQYQLEVNEIFTKTGLLYFLNAGKEIERIVECDTLTEEIENSIEMVQEQGTKALLKEAINLYRNPRPESQHLAVEKIWDALERLKTYYSPVLDKSHSVEKIVNDMGNNNPDFSSIFDAEFRELTRMGNNYRIRHHETTKIDIADNRHYDYFFNRCLSLIALAIQYLN